MFKKLKKAVVLIFGCGMLAGIYVSFVEFVRKKV